MKERLHKSVKQYSNQIIEQINLNVDTPLENIIKHKCQFLI